MKIYLLTLLVFVLDQVLKWLVVQHLELHQSLPVIQGVFHLTYVRNTGAAFSLLASRPGLLTLAALVIIIFLVVFLKYLPAREKLVRAALAVILGGALGNLLDRVRLGYVIDYLDLRVWPVFNLADMAIVVGVGLLFLYAMKMPREKGL